jgi:hypothetical protein
MAGHPRTSYVNHMRRLLDVLLLFALVLSAPAVPAQTRSDDGTINIMRPEGTPPAKKRAEKKRREKTHHHAARRPKVRRAVGSSNPVYPAPLPGPQKPLPVPNIPYATPPRRAATPPPLLVPETGRLLPNLPPTGGSGPGGKESFPERAARCHQQAGIYGPNATGNPSAYINSCINQ